MSSNEICQHNETQRLGAIWTQCTQCGKIEDYNIPLFTEKPKQKWFGLTENQRTDIGNDYEIALSKNVLNAIEAILRSNNT